jgi:hypothetical protein
VVPETQHKDLFFVTEKTIKPIATKTPFLILSTPGYLQYLRGLGFKTFGTLIDESYDSEEDLEKRTQMIVNQVKYIVDHGSENFYQASQDIVNHNYNCLAEMVGKRDDVNDVFLYKLFGNLGAIPINQES